MSRKQFISFNSTLEPRVSKRTGLYPVCLVVNINGERKRYRTGKQLSHEQWEKIHARNLRDEKLKEIKKEIQEFINMAELVKINIEKGKIAFSFEEFELGYFKKVDIDRSEISLADCVKDFFENYKKDHKGKELSIQTIMMYETLSNSINNFKANIKINQVTLDFLIDYEESLRKKGKSISTIGIYLRQLKAIINYAISKKYMALDKYPFKGFEIQAAESNKRALDDNGIKALLNYNSAIEPEQKAVDFWIFSYLGNGINFKDIAKLKFNNIKGDSMNFVRAKTMNSKRIGKEINFYLLPKLNEILSKYGNKMVNSTDYIFPILNNKMTPLEEHKAIKQFIKTTNKYLKRVGSSLDFEIPLTTYFSRHSWATKMRNSGVSVDYISEGLGHSSIKTTENYLGKFPAKDVIENAIKLLNFD